VAPQGKPAFTCNCKVEGRSSQALIAPSRHGIEGVNVQADQWPWSREGDEAVVAFTEPAFEAW